MKQKSELDSSLNHGQDRAFGKFLNSPFLTKRAHLGQGATHFPTLSGSLEASLDSIKKCLFVGANSPILCLLGILNHPGVTWMILRHGAHSTSGPLDTVSSGGGAGFIVSVLHPSRSIWFAPIWIEIPLQCGRFTGIFPGGTSPVWI